MFEIMTADNTAHITLNDNLGRAPTEQMLIGNGTKSIAFAVIGYANRHKIQPRDIGYSVRPATESEVGQ